MMLAFTLPVYSDHASPNFLPFLLLICKHLEEDMRRYVGQKWRRPTWAPAWGWWQQGGSRAPAGQDQEWERPGEPMTIGPAALPSSWDGAPIFKDFDQVSPIFFLKLTSPHQPETIRRRPLIVSRVWRCARLLRKIHQHLINWHVHVFIDSTLDG